MATYRNKICTVCNGTGYLSNEIDGNTIFERCGECDATGKIKVAITRFEKLMELDVMANFLNQIVQDCRECPCMKCGICEGSFNTNCIDMLKIYLSKEYSEEDNF